MSNQTKQKATVEKPKRGKIILRPIQSDAKFVSQEGVMYEQKEYFTFKSRIVGTIFYPGDDGSAKQIEGMSIRDDISPREREFLISSETYEDGWIVELNNTELENASSVNALNDYQLTQVCKQYLEKKDKLAILKYIEDMTTNIALEALKSEMEKQKFPGFIIRLVDSRIEELAEEYEKSMLAPIPDMKEKG